MSFRFVSIWIEFLGMNIDRQINFAIEKKVKKLEMNLSNCRGISQYNKYFFPHKDFPTCNSLTTLRLKNVNVTGEVIEHFLSNYLALETLYIQSSDSLVNLKVAGPLLRLKYLEIRYCSVKKWRFQPWILYHSNILDQR
jgi:hypothetical protein